MANEILNHVNVKNKNILNLLNGWKDFVLDNRDNISKNVWTQHAAGQFSEGLDQYMTDKYRKYIVDQGRTHSGFPEQGYYVQLKPDQIKWNDDADKNWQSVLLNRYNKFNDSMIFELGIRRNALCVAYPPTGFIGWHNNANASAYNLIFTYSETGDGYWQHINPHTNEVETVKDVAGWQCKATYFGAYEENDPNTIIYHTAKTNSCWRLTVSYVFDRKHKDWWQQALEEIEND